MNKKYVFIFLSLTISIYLISVMIDHTSAYYLDNAQRNNRLSIGENVIQIKEEFPPVNDLKGNTNYQKKVSFLNTGSVDCYIRAYVVCSNEDIDIDIDFNMNDYEYIDGYYYYKKELRQDEESLPLCNQVHVGNIKNDVRDFEIYVYVESVQSDTFVSAKEAFSKLKDD